MIRRDADRVRLVRLWIDDLAGTWGNDAAVARQLGVNSSTVNRWRHGGGIDLPNLIKLADLAGASLGDVLIMFYGVSPEQLAPTVPVVRADRIVDPDGRVLSGHFRMLLIDDVNDPDDRVVAGAGAASQAVRPRTSRTRVSRRPSSPAWM